MSTNKTKQWHNVSFPEPIMVYLFGIVDFRQVKTGKNQIKSIYMTCLKQ